MKLSIQAENILDAIALQSRKVFHPGDGGKLSSPISLFSLIYYVT
ncbi:hypothetical protein [Nostoc sp.]